MTQVTGHVDAFVTAYRTQPRLLELLLESRTPHGILQGILERANDHGIADRVGIAVPSRRDRSAPRSLTKREREVIDVLCQGLTNKEIARTLFITEATVKVHVRRICQKFGVRSRTEAAMRAAEIND